MRLPHLDTFDDMPNNTSTTDASKADIGIVCGLGIEVGALLSRCERVRKYTSDQFTFHGGRLDGIRIVVAETGHGLDLARRGTEALIDGHSPEWVLSCGFSSALVEQLPIGTVIVSNSIVDAAGNEISIDVNMDDGPGRRVGRSVTTKEVVRLIADRTQLATTHNAIAVDTQSHVVAHVCRDRSQRFMSIRSINCDQSMDLPTEVLSVIGSTGSMRLGAALGSIWKRPGSVKDMWGLRENAMTAADRLSTFLDGVLIQLGAKP